MSKLFLLGILLLLIFPTVEAQSKITSGDNILLLHFSKADIGQLRQIEQIESHTKNWIKQSDQIFIQVHQLLTTANNTHSADLQKTTSEQALTLERTANNLRFKAIDSLHYCAGIRNEIYKRNLKLFRTKYDIRNGAAADSAEMNAGKLYAKASVMREISYNHNPQQAYKDEMNALAIEMQANDLLSNVLSAIVKNQPVTEEFETVSNVNVLQQSQVNNSQKNNGNQTSEEVQQVFTIQLCAVKSPLTEDQLTELYNGNEVVKTVKENSWIKYTLGKFKSLDDALLFKKKNNLKGIIVTKETESRPKKEKAKHVEKTIYRIQIAASKTPLSEDELNDLFNLNQSINIEKINGWYKYSIGNFTSLNEAMKFKKKTRIKEKFISIYKEPNTTGNKN